MQTTSTVTRRESFLIETYHANESVIGYNHNKKVKQNRASKLLSELRSRYGAQVTVKNVDMNVTADAITQNGKYSCE